jgi:hypothetical protein
MSLDILEHLHKNLILYYIQLKQRHLTVLMSNRKMIKLKENSNKITGCELVLPNGDIDILAAGIPSRKRLF